MGLGVCGVKDFGLRLLGLRFFGFGAPRREIQRAWGLMGFSLSVSGFMI